MTLPRAAAEALSIRQVSATDVRPLRSVVLRNGAPPHTLVYEGDEHPLAFHAGAFQGDDLVGVATIYPETPPVHLRGEIPEAAYNPAASFRLRGMATLPHNQGRGVGRAVVQRCLEHIYENGASHLWCNARVGALGFYERMGFVAVGDRFDMPGIGDHFVMWYGTGSGEGGTVPRRGL